MSIDYMRACAIGIFLKHIIYLVRVNNTCADNLLVKRNARIAFIVLKKKDSGGSSYLIIYTFLAYLGT